MLDGVLAVTSRTQEVGPEPHHWRRGHHRGLHGGRGGSGRTRSRVAAGCSQFGCGPRAGQPILCRWGTKNFTVHAHDQFPGELTAHPIRTAATVEGDKSNNRAALGLATDRPTLLVTGASNGASTLNALVLNLARTQPEAFAGWQILHLAGGPPLTRPRDLE